MQAEPPSVQVEVSLAEGVISLGEPVVLWYTFLGTLAEPIRLYTGRSSEDWLTLSLTDEEGNPAPTVPDPRMRQGGLYSVTVSTSATRPAVRYVVVSRLLRPDRPGDYNLCARLRMPYALASQAAGIASPFWERTFGTVLAREDAFPLTITETDPARLYAVAEELAGQAVQDGDASLRECAVRSLFAMPGEYVLPVWQEVTTSEDPRLLNLWGVISDELARVQSALSADLLVEMAWNPPPAVRELLSTPDTPGFNRMAANNVRVKFHNMYFTADSSLKQHLAELYTARGFQVPQKRVLI